ncbi:MAG: RNA polymerase sigma factor [Anaerolineales bacterium]
MLNSLTREGVVPARQASDGELWQRLALGDEAALAEVYDQQAAQLYGLCVRILREPKLAEAALVKTLALAWEKAGSEEAPPNSLSAWLVDLARTVCVEALRRSVAASSPQVKTRPGFAQRTTLPRAKRARQIQQAMAELSLEEWLVIEQAYFCGFTCAEIARHLDWPEGAVSAVARAGLRNLRKQLAARGIYPEG